jgi:hypothetical protein
VATLGVDWRQEQATKLLQYRHRFIMYDPDAPGQKRARQLADWLGVHAGTTELILGLESDPGSLPPKQVRSIRKKLLGRYA